MSTMIFSIPPFCSDAAESATLTKGPTQAMMSVTQGGDLRTYRLSSSAELRDNRPPDKQVEFSEDPNHATLRTGNVMFDGLYAMAVHEALLNSVPQIKDWAFGNNTPISLEAFQTGEFWTYVWTRDLSYSVYLALGGFDPPRAVSSLLFKTSVTKPSVAGGFTNQIIQDTGSGGSYPVSSDRIVWALGADATLKFLPADEQEKFLKQIYPILHDTIEQDRRLVFDPADGLYRGEQSFLDWREQTYPGWTKDNVLAIGMSKALSVNAADYFLLKTTAGYAGRLGLSDDKSRYHRWAEDLKKSINEHFFDREAGLYSTYLLSDGVNEIRVHRYDLLGESLAILLGVADQSLAEAIVKNYPVGPHGPPVVWPQERTVPIYHNQAMWPFVTAFWIKAAREANQAEAVNQGVESLERLAAFNLSNMENFDFVTGLAQVKGATLDGPVINSRRQLWSVAGYLSMVQDVVFGLETSWDDIRFRPFITAKMRNEIFVGSDQIELRDFVYRGVKISVRVHLPPVGSFKEGVCAVSRIELNGKSIGDKFVPDATLQATNQWDIYLATPKSPENPASLRMVDVTKERNLFGPLQPVWDETQHGGITVADGKLVLHYRHDDAANVFFNIYRDGALCAKAVHETNWIDAGSGDYLEHLHSYAVEAVDSASGNVSHLTPSRSWLDAGMEVVIPAGNFGHEGGNLVDNHHFENWGRTNDTLWTKSFKVSRGGRYAIRTEFSNGAGPVNTGITCAVKKLEVQDAGTGKAVASGYLVMPQSGDWKRWDLSSPVLADLSAGKDYIIRISEDDVSRNMSYLKNNERYTAWPGGGDAGYNFVNISALRLTNIANDKM
jgi:Bacterial alpha-L-rhamnosidase 6 hairpin glycosidase domain